MPSAIESDLDYLRGWINREQTVEDTLTFDLARKFHGTLDLPGSPPEPGSPAQPLIHFCLAQMAAPTAELGVDGHPRRGGFLPDIPLPRRMWAASDIRFCAPLLVGQTVRRISRVSDVTAKEGRSGPLFFVTVEHRLETGSQMLLRDVQDIVYREAAPSGAPAPSATPVAPPGEHRRTAIVSAPLLFRYSALTFNSHRIHYDRSYATEEGYPDLVVHGPLQATLLIALAKDIHGRAPERFTFRSQAPLFESDKINLHASWNGEALHLWTARENGPVAMSAVATWT